MIDVELVHRTATVLRSKAGLVFAPEHLRDVEAGMTLAMSTLGLESAATLLTRVIEESPRGQEAFNHLVQAVTIGETYFFRYPEQFKVLREQVLAPLIARKRAAGDWTLRLWSAACSTGEETYSLAMTVADVLPDLALWRVSILGTDINLGSLQKARAGVYGNWSFRGVPEETRTRCFRPTTTAAGPRFEIAPEYKAMVHFAQLNLNQPSYPHLMTQTTAMDVVFCRNVLIYFSQDAIREVATRMHNTLVDGGVLFLGPAEPNDDIFSAFRSEFAHGTMLYRRDDEHARGVQAVPVVEARRPPTAKPRHAARFKAAATRLSAPAQKASPTGAVGVAALGFGMFRDGRLDEAAACFRKAIELEPDRAEAYFMLAVLAADKGDFSEASTFCDEALRKDAMDVRYYHLASILEGERGAHERSVELLKKAIFLDRKFIMGHFGLGASFKALGKRDEAARYLRNCLELLVHIEDDAMVPGVEEIAAGWLRQLVQGQVRELAEDGQRLRSL